MVKPRQPLFQPAEPLFLGRIKMQCNVVINCFLSHFCTHSFPLTKFWSLVFHFFFRFCCCYLVSSTLCISLSSKRGRRGKRDSRGSLFAIKMNFLLYPLPSKTVKTKPECPVCGHSLRRRDISGLLRAENERTDMHAFDK